MSRSMILADNENFAHNPVHRGYCPVYHERQVNHCPGCGRTQWYVGRISAECSFCATALPLADSSARGSSFSRSHRPIFFTTDGVRQPA